MTLIDVESTSSPAAESMTVLKAITAVHLADSRGHFRTSQLSLRRGSKDCSSSAAAGSGWPERPWNHFKPLRTRFRPTFGPWSQKLDHIGASGIIVIRIPKWSPARSALAALQRRLAEGKSGHFPTHWEQIFFTLRRSRGATGRYQGPTGARSTAPRRSRRRRTVPTPFPGGGRGINV